MACWKNPMAFFRSSSCAYSTKNGPWNKPGTHRDGGANPGQPGPVRRRQGDADFVGDLTSHASLQNENVAQVSS